MVECNDCGNKEKDCGCTNEGLTINDVCNPIVCDSSECSESFAAECILYTGDDITCDEIVIITAGDNLAQAVANITAYFCTRTTVQADIVCDVDTVVAQGTAVTDALTQIVTYFCNAIATISLTPGPEGPQGPQGPAGIDGADWTLATLHIDIANAVSPFVIAEDGAFLNALVIIDEITPPDTVPAITEFTTQLGPSEGDINEVINMEESTSINIRPNNATTTVGVWAPGGYIEAVGTGQAVQFSGATPTKGLAIEMKCISVNGADVLWLITNHTWNGADPVIV